MMVLNAEELANKFKQKVSAAVVENRRQAAILPAITMKSVPRIWSIAGALMEREVIPFLQETQHHLGEVQFSFATQIETKFITVLLGFPPGG